MRADGSFLLAQNTAIFTSAMPTARSSARRRTYGKLPKQFYHRGRNIPHLTAKSPPAVF